MRRVTTSTISLPPELSTRARRLARAEGRTISELFREAFRVYEVSRSKPKSLGQSPTLPWQKLHRRLQEIGRHGRPANLGRFVILDRQRPSQ